MAEQGGLKRKERPPTLPKPTIKAQKQRSPISDENQPVVLDKKGDDFVDGRTPNVSKMSHEKYGPVTRQQCVDDDLGDGDHLVPDIKQNMDSSAIGSHYEHDLHIETDEASGPIYGNVGIPHKVQPPRPGQPPAALLGELQATLQTKSNASGNSRPKPRPRTSIVKKQSTENKREQSPDVDAREVFVADRSISSSSQDSVRSLNRSHSYEAALDKDTVVEAISEEYTNDSDSPSEDNKLTAEELRTKMARNKSYAAAVDDIDPSLVQDPEQVPKSKRKVAPENKHVNNVDNHAKGQVHQEGHISRKPDIPQPKRKAPAPPRPSRDPVGQSLHTPEGSSRENSPGPQHLRVGTQHPRPITPPKTPPKPMKRKPLESDGTPESSPDRICSDRTKSKKMSISASTPNISKETESENRITLRKKEHHHHSSVDIKGKENKSSGAVSNLVHALSRLGSSASDKKSEHSKEKRRNSSHFYCNVDGSATVEEEPVKESNRWSFGYFGGKKDKKEKRKSGSKFYCDVNTSENGTVKTKSKKDPILSTKSDGHYDDCNTDSQVQVVQPEQQSSSSGHISHMSHADDLTLPPKEKQKSENTEISDILENEKHEALAKKCEERSDSPVAPPRSKRKGRASRVGQSQHGDHQQADVYAEIDISESDEDTLEQRTEPPEPPPRPELIHPSQLSTDHSPPQEVGENIYAVPDESHLSDSGENEIYTNHERARLNASMEENQETENVFNSPPTIVIRSSSNDNTLETNQEHLIQDESQMDEGDSVILDKNFPSLDELNAVYLPMSPSMPAGLMIHDSMDSTPSNRNSGSSTASNDYIPMSPENLLSILGGPAPESNQRSFQRPSSWAGPDTDDCVEIPGIESERRKVMFAELDESNSTEDSEESSDENEARTEALSGFILSLQQIKEKLEKKNRKAFLAAQEIMTTEANFVNVLKLINEDFRKHVKDAKGPLGGPVVPYREVDQILRFLPLLQTFSEDLLKDLKERVDNWEQNHKIADVFVKKGPFLKMYTDYIREFENMCDQLEETRKRYPDFDKAANEFEASSKCFNLAIKHFMLKPIQRIPQYRLMLQEYQKYIPEGAPDYEDTEAALKIVCGVADHANKSMAFGDNVKKLIEIQNNLMGQFEVVKPGRLLIKSGVLKKLCRKEMQPRHFFLFNDVLLCTTPLSSGYRYNSELPLAGMKVSKPTEEDFKNELSIISTAKSFRLSASTPEERDEWLKLLQDTVKEYNKKRYSYLLKSNSTGSSDVQQIPETEFKLGQEAPVWVPDARVSMCVKCHEEFTVTFRRHHCRACGKVFCGPCCDNRAPLRYRSYKPERVCIDCFEYLKNETDHWLSSLERKGEHHSGRHAVILVARGFVRGTNQGQGTLWGSFGKGKKKRATVLEEVKASEENVDLSGYMAIWESKRWKRLWFVLKHKVLYFYKGSEDTAAVKSIALVGFEVRSLKSMFQRTEAVLLFELAHKNLPSLIFKADNKATRDRWVKHMTKATYP